MGASQTNLEVLIQIREDLAGLRKARADLQGAKKDASDLGSALKQGLGIGTGMQMVTAGIGLLVAAIKNSVGEAINLSEQLKDTSESLGISTTELQVFRLELQDAGVDVGRLSMAISEQTRSLAEARDSGSAAAQAYRALGLSAAALERLSPGERILAVVRATDSAKDKFLAFSAAAQVLGTRELPRFLSALGGLATQGVPAVTALRDAQGRLLSKEAIDRIDAAKKQWEGFWGSIVVGSGEALKKVSQFNDTITQPVAPRWDVMIAKPTGIDKGAQFEAQVRKPAPGAARPSFLDVLLARETPGAREQLAAEAAEKKAAAEKAAADATAKAAADKAAADKASADAAQSRQDALDQLAAKQLRLAEIQDASATAEANEALTVEQKTAAKRAALEAEVAVRQQIVELLNRTQASGDFRTQSDKDAEMLKAKGDLTRAQNALASQSNTAAQQQARELFRLETEAIAAEAAGNTRIADQKREQIKLLQLTAQLEGQQPALVQARITAERELTEAQRERATKDLDYSQSIAQVDQQIANIEADNSLTERERQAKLLPLYELRNKLTADYIALLEKAPRLQQGDQAAIDLRKQINDLNKEIADTKGKSAAAAGPETLAMRDAKGLRGMGIGTNADGSPAQIDPSQHYTSVEAGIGGGAANVVAQLGTDGDIAAAAIRDNLNSALSDSVSWLDQLAQGAITFQQFWQGAIGYVGDMFRKMAIEMVAKMIWQHTVGRALTAVSVAFHVQGEATKTSSTLSGATIRIASTIKEALADVYHGAVAAFKALASIPYAGPFLAAAAMAAALAGGIALVNKIGHEKGGYTANVGTGEVAGVVHGKEWVAPAWMLQDNRFGPIISMLEGARTGTAAAADLLSADVTAGIAAPIMVQQAAAQHGGGGLGRGTPEAPKVSVALASFNNQQHARNWLESTEGDGYMINYLKQRAWLFR